MALLKRPPSRLALCQVPSSLEWIVGKALLQIPMGQATLSDLNPASSSGAVALALWARRPSVLAVLNQQDDALSLSCHAPAKRGASGGQAIPGKVAGFNQKSHSPGGPLPCKRKQRQPLRSPCKRVQPNRTPLQSQSRRRHRPPFRPKPAKEGSLS